MRPSHFIKVPWHTARCKKNIYFPDKLSFNLADIFGKVNQYGQKWTQYTKIPVFLKDKAHVDPKPFLIAK